MHSRRMLFTVPKGGGGWFLGFSLDRDPLDRDAPGQKYLWTKAPRRNMGPESEALEGTWDQTARQEVASYLPPSRIFRRGQTNAF